MPANYKDWLIVSDIDGTLNNKKRKLPEINKTAIIDFTSKGGNFTLASGRNLQSLTPNYKKIGIKTPAIFLNGAGIYDFSTESILSFTAISPEAEKEIIKAADKFKGAEVTVFTDDMIYLVNPRFFGYIMSAIDKLDKKVCKNKFNDVPLSRWGKVTFFGTPGLIKRIDAYFKSDKISSICSGLLTSPYTLEIVNKGVNKGTAVNKLAEILNINKKNIAAIGDYYNDTDMLKAVSHPACCGQAPNDIKNISEHVACHCNDGAVADFINYIEEKYINITEVT